MSAKPCDNLRGTCDAYPACVCGRATAAADMDFMRRAARHGREARFSQSVSIIAEVEQRSNHQDYSRHEFELWATTDPHARSVFYATSGKYRSGHDQIVDLGDLNAPWLKKDASGLYWDEQVQAAWIGWQARARYHK